MARTDSRTKGVRKVNFTARLDVEVRDYLTDEAARRTFEARMDRAREMSDTPRGASAIYNAAKKMGTLGTLGPELSAADVVNMAIDCYRAAV